MSRPRFAEFFAGAGLFRLGLEAAGWECVFANDNDPNKAAIYRANFGGGHFAEEDVRKLDVKLLPQCDLATASFPCTDLSLAGGRSGLSGKRSSAFYGFVQALEKIGSRRPPMVLLENVPGLLTSGGGKDIQKALAAISGLGYRLDMFIMDARWFTPQSRPRLFILGTNRKMSAGRKAFKERDPRLKSPAIERAVRSARNVEWNFIEIPSPPDASSQILADILEKDGEAKWWDAARTAKLISRIGENRIGEVEEAISGRRTTYATVFLRMRKGIVMAEPRMDGLAGCLRTPRGGSSRQILLRMGGGQAMARYLTARECGRLQGVDGGYILPKSQSAGLFAFGDAVCAPLIEWIAANVLNPLL